MYIVITMRASPPYLKNNWQSVRRKKKKLSEKRNTLNLLILLHDARAVRSHAKWSSSLPISWDRIPIKLQLTGKSCLIIQFIMIKNKILKMIIPLTVIINTVLHVSSDQVTFEIVFLWYSLQCFWNLTGLGLQFYASWVTSINEEFYYKICNNVPLKNLVLLLKKNGISVYYLISYMSWTKNRSDKWVHNWVCRSHPLSHL